MDGKKGQAPPPSHSTYGSNSNTLKPINAIYVKLFKVFDLKKKKNLIILKKNPPKIVSLLLFEFHLIYHFISKQENNDYYNFNIILYYIENFW